jgi:hypothetical protein
MIKHLAARMRPPRLGRIRLGIKKISASGAEYPAEVPYFVLPAELVERFPKEPTELDVLLPFDDLDQVLVTEYVRYSGSGGKGGGILTLRCDGERFLQIPKNTHDPTMTGPCRRPMPEHGEPIPACECGATARGRLRVMLIKGPVGYHEINLGGDQRIGDLMSDLKVQLLTFGRLTDIPFKLLRVPTSVQVATDKGDRIPKVGWPVRLQSTFTVEQAMLARGRDPMVLPGTQRALESGQPTPPHIIETDEEALAHEAAQEEEPDQDDTAPVPEAPPDDDISIAIGRAVALGITERAYRTFLEATYGEPFEALAVRSEIVAEQMLMFGGAESDMARSALKATIIAKVNQAMRRPRS